MNLDETANCGTSKILLRSANFFKIKNEIVECFIRMQRRRSFKRNSLNGSDVTEWTI